MERFAFKIDAALKANLYKICRLCGIDNPSKVPILPNERDPIDLDEPSLSQKVLELVGFVVSNLFHKRGTYTKAFHDIIAGVTG